MILVTGAYGFIGSKFVEHLNALNWNDVDVSDYLTNGHQFNNLDHCKFTNYVYPDNIDVSKYVAIFHFGAVSSTTCWDGEMVMKRNYQFTKDLIDRCVRHNVRLSYSSSAAVYGNQGRPLNLYAYSKFLIDQYVTSLNSDLIQGFRYFNVYSEDDAERHKGEQASPFYKFKQQALEKGYIELFEGSENFYRDFVPVQTVCDVQLLMFRKLQSGIYDIGTGKQMSFTDVAQRVADTTGASIRYVPFPAHLRGHYQTNTLANMSYLK